MKRTKFAAALAVLTLLTTLTGCGQAKEADGALEPVTLNEVAHSIFYAPQYAAIELGYFKDEGIALTLVNGAGADKVMTSLISGDADIGFMGSEASIYVYQEGSADYAVNFAQLTQRAGNFLVGRSAEPDFSWQDLKGKKVLGGRAGGMPEMVFEYAPTNGSPCKSSFRPGPSPMNMTFAHGLPTPNTTLERTSHRLHLRQFRQFSFNSSQFSNIFHTGFSRFFKLRSFLH